MKDLDDPHGEDLYEHLAKDLALTERELAKLTGDDGPPPEIDLAAGLFPPD